MTCSLTGALGKRTKFQTFTTSHLVVTTRSGLASPEWTARVRAGGAGRSDEPRPRLVKNEDWDLLEELTFESPIVDEPLALDELAILLARSLDVRSHNPSSVLTDEEMAPYARRVLSNEHLNWLLAATALLVRSRLEIKGKKTLERAMAQIQSLLDERNAPPPPDALRRLDRVFSVSFPPWWDLQRELGAVFLKLGLARAALDMYEPLEMWDEIVSCYVSIGSARRAEIIVRRRLAAAETPFMHCVLGDLLESEECYARAWALSEGHSPRAQRSWGAVCFARKDYAAAIEHFELALAVNPIFPALWFTMGMAAMFSERWDKSAESFSRCVQYDPENAEAWANLAGAYQRMGEPRRALTCLSEALKHKRDSWRMWENYLYVCMQVGEHLAAMRAVVAILDNNQSEKRIDGRVVRALVGVYARMVSDAPDARETRFYRARLDEMFDAVLALTTSSVGVWHAYASLALLDGDLAAVYARALSRLRAAQGAAGWEHDAAKFAEVVDAADALADALEALPSPDEVVVPLRLAFASAYKQSARMLEHDPARARLRALIVRIGGDPDEDLSVRAD